MEALLKYKEDGKIKLGLLKNNLVYDISDNWKNLKDLIIYTLKNKINISKALSKIELNNGIPYDEIYSHILPPIYSEKIYGLGITYKVSESTRIRRSKDSAHMRAVKSGKLVTFYKGDFHNCAGTNGPLSIRGDSKLTVPEPELGAVISSKGNILGYTIFNDVTAYDIEMTSSLFTPEAKEYMGSCGIGPLFVPVENFQKTPKLKVNIKIFRKNKLILERSSRSDLIRDEPQKLIKELCKYRYIPNGTIVAMGSSVAVPDDFSLQEGDETIIEIEKLGFLKNKFKKL